MILYQFPGGSGLSSVSPPCVKVEMALRLIGQPCERVNCYSRTQAGRVSRTGRLPVLEVDGERIADSIDILDALERRFPDSGLSPSDPEERLRDRLWEHFANDHLYWIGYYLRWFPPENRERTFRAFFGRAPFYVRWGARLVFLRSVAARGHAVGIAGKMPEQVMRSAVRGMEMVESGLADGPFLQGRETPGRGDLACASFFAQAGFRDTLPDYVGRIRSRPALVDHTVRVFEACSMDLPRWLQ